MGGHYNYCLDLAMTTMVLVHLKSMGPLKVPQANPGSAIRWGSSYALQDLSRFH